MQIEDARKCHISGIRVSMAVHGLRFQDCVVNKQKVELNLRYRSLTSYPL